MKKLYLALTLAIMAIGPATAQNISDSYYIGSPNLDIDVILPGGSTATDTDDQVYIQTEGGPHHLTVRLIDPLPAGVELHLEASGPITPLGHITLSTSQTTLFTKNGGATNFLSDLFYELHVEPFVTPQSFDIDLEFCIYKTQPNLFYCFDASGDISIGIADEVMVFPDLSVTFQPRTDHPDGNAGYVEIVVGTATLEWESSGPNKMISAEAVDAFPWDVRLEISNVVCSTANCGLSSGTLTFPEHAGPTGPVPVVTMVNGSGTADATYTAIVPFYELSQTNNVTFEYTIE